MKKTILGLLLLLTLCFVITSCDFIKEAFKQDGITTTTEPSPSTTVKPSTTITPSTSTRSTKTSDVVGYSVYFNNNGHGAKPKDLSDLTNLPDPLPVLEDDDYEFLGWGLEPNSTQAVKAGAKISSTIELYAIWKEKLYTIKFDVNGHGTKPSDIKNVTKLPISLPTLEDSEYKFLGWSLEADSDELVSPGSKIKSNVTLYAVWTEKTYTITYYANGHGEAPAKVLEATRLPSPLPEMTEPGYNFLGWSSSNLSVELVKANQKLSTNMSLYGIWEEATYDLTYDANGHGEAPAKVSGVTKVPSPLPTMPDVDGYTFLGWTLTPDATRLVFANQKLTEDTTLYAKWEALTYNITYDANGHGKAPNDDMQLTHYPDPLPKMAEEGYTFKGWALSSTSQELVEPGSKLNEDVTLYGVWEEQSYTVTFDANGYGTAPTERTNLTALPDPLPTITADGHVFKGWSLSPTSTELVEAGKKITSDTTLYAVWDIATYSVTYNANGHGDAPSKESGVTALPDPLPTMTAEGYIFKGWSIATTSTTLVNAGDEISSNVTLYGVWEEALYTITYDSNGHGDAPAQKTNVKAFPNPLPTMTADGYKFKGWSLSYNSTETVTAGERITANTTLYAVWEEITYNVTYVANGHGEAPNSTTGVTSLPNPLPTMTAEGYTFKGWAKSSTDAKAVKSGEKLSSNITLYGIWKKDTYRVIYHNNGRGTVPDETSGVVSLPNPLPTMTDDEYEFMGWGLFDDSTEAVTPGTSISANIDLYAIWKLKTYTITYNANGHGSNPESGIGATKLPDQLPTINGVENYEFVGWSLASDSTKLVDAGKKIYADTTLYAVWVSNVATITNVTRKSTLTEYAANDLDNSMLTYHDLSKLVYEVEYSDNSKVEVVTDKNMLSAQDYVKLQTPGEHTVTVNVLGVPQDETLTTVNYWEIKYYVRGNLIQCYPFRDGTNSNTPTTPSDYVDDNNTLWAFDRWSASDENVHNHMSINALFKEVELFSYNVLISGNNEISLTIKSDDRVTDYTLKIVDIENNVEFKNISSPDKDVTINGFVSARSYKVTGTYTFNCAGVEFDAPISEYKFELSNVTELLNIVYEPDDRGISSNSITLDISSYVESAPEGYKLDKVYLVKTSDDTVVGEYTYNGEDQVIYFDDLEEETEYESYFFYTKIKTTLLSYRTGAKYAPTKINYNPDYGFCFAGFRVFTNKYNAAERCVRVVYNDPQRGEKLLYRYYVSSGSDVPYSSFYSTPWSFALPLIYGDYFAFGDYQNLKNITADKTVEVYLIPKLDTEAQTHTVVFIGYSTSGNSNQYEHILEIREDVPHGSAITGPTGFEYYLPEDSAQWHYEFAWTGGYGRFSADIDNVTQSGIIAASYTKNEILIPPEFKPTLSMGEDFFTYNYVFSTPSSIYADPIKHTGFLGARAYLTEGPLNSSTEYKIYPDVGYNSVTYKSLDAFKNNLGKIYVRTLSGSGNSYIYLLATENDYVEGETYYTEISRSFTGTFSNLSPGKYVFHYEIDYDIQDGTGVHTRTVEIPFAPGAANMLSFTTSTANQQNITINYTGTKDKSIGFVLTKDNDNEIKQGWNGQRNMSTNNTSYSYSRVDNDQTYRIYSYKYDSAWYAYIDGNYSVTQAVSCPIYKVSTLYKTQALAKTEKPTDWVMVVKTKTTTNQYGTYYREYNSGSYIVVGDNNKRYDSRVKIYFNGTSSTQIDYGDINVHYTIYTNEYYNDPYMYDPYGMVSYGMTLTFTFDHTLGCYVTDQTYFYNDLFDNERRGFRAYVMDLSIEMYCNGYQTFRVINKISQRMYAADNQYHMDIQVVS